MGKNTTSEDIDFQETDMRRHLSRPIDAYGFTLLEIMISIFIFAIVITTILASYQAVFFKSHRLDAGLDLYTMAGSCLNRLSLDMDAVAINLPPKYKKPDVDSEPDPWRIVGDSSDLQSGDFSRIRFASRAHAGLNGMGLTGITEIVYYVDEDTNGNAVLRRSDRLYPYEVTEKEIEDPVVCEHMKSLVFTYYDEDGETSETWDSESEEIQYATPRAIHVKLEIGRSETESFRFDAMLMPPVLRSALD